MFTKTRPQYRVITPAERAARLQRRRPFSKIVFVPANGYPALVYTPFMNELAQLFKCDVSYVEVHDTIAKNGVEDCSWEPALVRVANELQGKGILAVGHSMGALLTLGALHSYGGSAQACALFDPPMYRPLKRLLMEPLMRYRIGPVSKYLSSQHRRAKWPSRDEAMAYLEQKYPIRNFHPEILHNFKLHGLRETDDGEVSLVFPPVAEAAFFLGIPTDLPLPGKPSIRSVQVYLNRRFSDFFFPMQQAASQSPESGCYFYSLQEEFGSESDYRANMMVLPKFDFFPVASHFLPLESPYQAANLVAERFLVGES
ncbi:hypothetical protein DIPPA_09897 [Diplonema papillatum]|nr:hypothetical protein DIPPA_09897 [Diplonema papillatum]